MAMRRCFCNADVEGGQGGHVEDPGAQEGAEPRQRPHAAAQVRDHAAARQGGGGRRGRCIFSRGVPYWVILRRYNLIKFAKTSNVNTLHEAICPLPQFPPSFLHQTG